jgi:hypothetical protein
MANIRSFITTLCAFTITLFILAFGVLERPTIVLGIVQITTSLLPALRSAITDAGANVPIVFKRDLDFAGLGASGNFGIALCLRCCWPSMTLPL